MRPLIPRFNGRTRQGLMAHSAFSPLLRDDSPRLRIPGLSPVSGSLSMADSGALLFAAFHMIRMRFPANHIISIIPEKCIL